MSEPEGAGEPPAEPATTWRERWPAAPSRGAGALWRRLPGETYAEWGVRARAWKETNKRFLVLTRIVNFQRMTLLAGLTLASLLVFGAGTLRAVPPPDSGLGVVLDLPYKRHYATRYPDCWPAGEPGHPEPRSLLVVLLDASEKRMTRDEFNARRRAKERALAEVFIVGFCSKRLPAFTRNIEPLGPPGS